MIRLEKKKKSRNRTYKIAASFILVLSITFGTVMSTDATRADFIHFFQHYFSFNSGRTEAWDTAFNDQIANNVHDVYLPTWIPDGFKGQESLQGNSDCTIVYKFSDKNPRTIRFTQERMPKKLFSDSELSKMEQITIDHQIFYFGERLSKTSSMHKLLWKTNSNTFMVLSDISEEEILKFASGLAYKKG